MLSKHDIEFMKQSVREIINEWQTTITILQPLPLSEQPNYNNIMHEFVGDVKYETIVVPAERKDLVNNQTNNLTLDTVEYGKKNAGTILYAISNIIPVFDEDGNQIGVKSFKPNKDSIIAIDDTEDRYYIYAMRDRIGETLIVIKRHVGNKLYGADIGDNVPVDGLGDD